MRVTFRGESEKTLIRLSDIHKVSPTELLISYIYEIEKQYLDNKAHKAEVTNELHKPHKRFIHQN